MIATQTVIDPRLDQRGIGNAAARMGWVVEGKYYSYRVNDEIRGGQRTRLKAIDRSKVDSAYLWGAGENVTYYHPPNIQEAIAAADGDLNFASGEVDVLTFMEAGADNVLAPFGEGSVPDTLAADLLALGVIRVTYWPDRDTAGVTSAKKVRNALSGSGIHLEIKQLPESVGHKGDTNDLWQLVNFDRTAFFETLHNGPDLPLPAPEPKRPTFDSSSFGNQDTPPDLIRDIANALGLRSDQTNSAGWARKNVCCPFHDDHDPSATLNLQSGVLHCHVCGDSFGPHKVAERLSIDWKAYYPEQPRQRKQSRKQSNMPRRDSAAPDENDIATWAQPVDLPTLDATSAVNERYVSAIDEAIKHQLLDHRSILIQSPINTGKTRLLHDLISLADGQMNRPPRVLIITYLENLAGDIEQRFKDLGFIVYNDFLGLGVHWQGQDRIVCSLDSLHHLAGQHFDIVAIDEIEQSVPHIWGDTMKGGENPRAFETLCDLVRGATHFIGLDAHLTEKTKDFIEALRGPDTAVLRNDYRHEWGDLHLCKSPYTVIERGLNAALTASKPVVFLTYKNRSKILYQMCLDKGFDPDDIVLINGDTSQRDAIRQFRRNIDQNLAQTKILIASPSLATGIDIQTAVHGVYAIFDKQPLIPTAMLQMLGRCRNAGERWVWVQYADNQDYETDGKALRARAILKAKNTAAVADFDGHDVTAVDSTQRQIASVQAAWIADANRQRNMLFSTFVAYAQHAGYTLQYDNRVNSPVKDLYKQAKEAIAERNKDLTCSVEAVDPDMHHQLKKDGKSTDEDDAGYLRWQIEDVTGFEITPGLYDLFHKPRPRQRLRRFIDLDESLDGLQAIDRHEASQGTLLIKRGHFTAIRALVAAAITAVLGEPGLDSTSELTRQEIEDRMLDYLSEYGQDVLHHINRRSDYSQDTLAIFRRILNEVGIKLRYRQVMEDGQRFYRYFIDPDELTLWRNIARVGANYRRLKAEHGKAVRNYLSRGLEPLPIRDLSNPLDLPTVDGGSNGTYARWQAQIEAIPV